MINIYVLINSYFALKIICLAYMFIYWMTILDADKITYFVLKY